MKNINIKETAVLALEVTKPEGGYSDCVERSIGCADKASEPIPIFRFSFGRKRYLSLWFPSNKECKM